MPTGLAVPLASVLCLIMAYSLALEQVLALAVVVPCQDNHLILQTTVCQLMAVHGSRSRTQTNHTLLTARLLLVPTISKDLEALRVVNRAPIISGRSAICMVPPAARIASVPDPLPEVVFPTTVSVHPHLAGHPVVRPALHLLLGPLPPVLACVPVLSLAHRFLVPKHRLVPIQRLRNSHSRVLLPPLLLVARGLPQI